MGLFKRSKPEIRADTGTISHEDSLLQALLGGTSVTKTVALQIPTIASCIDLISGIVASTPIKLYRLNGNKVEEVTDDPRIPLLNDDTGDTLNAHDFWRAIISDYYLGKGGYAYINKQRGKVSSLHYVDETYVTPQVNTNHIFKDYDLLVDAKTYKPYDFLKILRNSKDGASGTGIVAENSKAIEVAYESLIFESNLVKKGGNKKGFLKSSKKLTDEAMGVLKTAFKNLYSNNSENVVVLNDGIDFSESSNTSVEMQLNENKVTNSTELCKIFHISPDVIAGKATDADMQSVAKVAAIPLFKTIECALDRDFLLEKEKKTLYWAFDTKELLKGNFKERMEAHGSAVEKGIMTRNEARYAEDLPEIPGMDVISMSLADVIYDTKTGTYFTPNTKTITNTDGAPNQVTGSEARAGQEPRIYAVDFDGTLCERAWPNIGAPRHKAIERVKQIKSAGNRIILWTCREGEKLESALRWCEEQGLAFDAVNTNLQDMIEQYGCDPRKISADYYFDDKNVLL